MVLEAIELLDDDRKNSFQKTESILLYKKSHNKKYFFKQVFPSPFLLITFISFF